MAVAIVKEFVIEVGEFAAAHGELAKLGDLFGGGFGGLAGGFHAGDISQGWDFVRLERLCLDRWDELIQFLHKLAGLALQGRGPPFQIRAGIRGDGWHESVDRGSDLLQKREGIRQAALRGAKPGF
jgi:hypothetical protein